MLIFVHSNCGKRGANNRKILLPTLRAALYLLTKSPFWWGALDTSYAPFPCYAPSLIWCCQKYYASLSMDFILVSSIYSPSNPPKEEDKNRGERKSTISSTLKTKTSDLRGSSRQSRWMYLLRHCSFHARRSVT